PVPGPGGQRVVEVALPRTHPAQVERRVVAYRGGAGGEVLAGDHRDRGHHVKAGQVPAGPGAYLVELVAGVLGREKDRQPTVGDLSGEPQIPRPERGEVDRNVRPGRMEAEFERLAGPAGQRQLP